MHACCKSRAARNADALRLLRTTAAAQPAADLAYLDARPSDDRFPDADADRRPRQDIRSVHRRLQMHSSKKSCYWQHCAMPALTSASVDVDTTLDAGVAGLLLGAASRRAVRSTGRTHTLRLGMQQPPAGLTPQEFFVGHRSGEIPPDVHDTGLHGTDGERQGDASMR